ncbi:MAG: glycosyltransferase family 4 protein [Nitrospiraceae bacterium]
MQIVVINDFAHVEGGASQVAIASAIGLAQRGHAVTFLAAVGPADAGLRDSAVRVELTGQHAIATDPSRVRAIWQGLWNPTAARRLAAILDAVGNQDTVVHLHGWTKALSSSVVREVLARRIPIVCTLNDYFTACPNGGFFDYSQNDICTRLPLGLSCIATHCDKRGYVQKLWRVLRQVIQQRAGRIPCGIRHFIQVSQFSRTVLQPVLPSHATFHALPNAIAVERQDRVCAAGNSAYVMVGRLDPEKGAAVFADAARQLDCEVVFVGDGPLRKDVVARCPRARVTGWSLHHQVIQELRTARAIVFPSLWYEAQPLAVREAAAMGIPAIVSDRCAARDDVTDGVTGLLFRGGDREDLRQKLRRLSDDRLVESLGAAAYDAYWNNPPSLARHVDRLEEIYGSILRSR